MKKFLKNVTLWGGMCLSIVFAYYALHKIDWSRTWFEVKHTRWLELAFALTLMWIGFLWRTIRWKRLIDVEKSISFKECFKVITIGYMANNLLPARIGEVARAYLLSRRSGVTKSFALGTIVTERLGDVLTLVALICTTLFLLPLPITVRKWVLLGIALVISFVLLMVVGVVWSYRVKVLVKKVLSLVTSANNVDYIVARLGSFCTGISCGRSIRMFALVSVDSFGIWFLSQLMTWEVAKACNVSVSITQILFVMCVVNLGAMLPSLPGYIGSYQALCIFALSFWGISRESAFAFSIVSHVVWYLPLTLLGLLFFAMENLKFQQISEPLQAE